MINQWDGVKSIACQSNSTAACIKTGQDVLKQFKIDEVRARVDYVFSNTQVKIFQSKFAMDLLLLVVLAVVLRILAFLALCLKARRKS